HTPPGSYLALVAKYIASDQLHIRNDEVWVSKSVWQLLTTLSQPNLFKWHKLIIANPKPQQAFNLWLAGLAKVNSTGQEQVFNQILNTNLDWQILTQELLNSLIDLLVSTKQQPNLSQTFFKTIKPDNHLKDKLSLLSQLVQLCQTYQLELAKATPLILPYTQGGKVLVTTWVNLLKLVENKTEQWSVLEFVPALPKTLPLEGGIKVFTQHMLVNGAASKTLFETTLPDIVKLTHQEMVINASLAYLAQQDNRLPIRSYIELFNNFSQLLNSQKLDEYECNCLVKLTVLNGGKTLAPIKSLLEWTLLFKQETGSAITHKLLKPFAVGDLSKLTKACYLIYQLYANAVSASSELDIYAINGGIDELVHGLTMAFNQINNQIDEQFSLAMVLNRFSAENVELTTTLTNEELAVIKQQYLAIMDKSAELADTAQLKTALSAIVQQPCQNLITILAVAYHKFKPHFGFHPHNTQILTVLALLLVKPEFKGRIAQVKTGEGKSTIVCLLALIQALSGRSVDIITSSRYLAIRDCEKYQEFFDDFGISSSHIAVENVSEKDFIGQILYGTNTDFEFALLFEQLYHHQTRVAYKDLTQLRQCNVVIVDEVDNLLIDKASESARIAMPSKHGLASYFKVVFNLVKNSGVLANLLIKPLLSQDNLPEIEDEILNKMLIAAHRALFGLRENHDYIIKEVTQNGITQPQVVIVDQENTGRLHEQSRYGRFVHEFLELKHDLPMGAETLTAASLSHPVFFAYYNNIFGLTGTLGSPIEREEVRYIYAIDNFDVPTHHPSLLKAMPPICLEDKATHYTALLTEAKAIKHAHRPCLILCQSIQAATNLHNYLAEHGVANQLLTALQAEDEEFIVANAGLPGMVTVATNTAGRGTDIILHPQSKQTGG
ncbi:MAG: DEAD/DEAH box helicase, partial [Burkholderiales bacterium]